MRYLCILWSIFISSIAYGGLFNPKTFELDNGLKVIVLENSRAPVVTQMVWYKVGSADDPMHANGVAHYLEHLMFKGPEGSASAEISKMVETCGGSLNAVTSSDYTYYYQTVASEYLEQIMRLEAERMSHLTIIDAQALPEKQVVLEERKTRYETNPIGRFMELMQANWYWHHPYGRPGIGWESDIQNLTPEKARAFYKRWYRPDNATLIIAGDVTLEKIKPLVEKYYGPISKPTEPLSLQERPIEPQISGVNQRLTLTSQDVVQPYLLRYYNAPTFKQNPKMAYALQVLAYLLSSGATSRFHKIFVEEKQIASFIQVHYDDNKDLATFSLAAQPTSKIDIHDLEKTIDAEIKTILKKGFTTAEVERAKKRFLVGLAYIRDNGFSGANELGSALSLGLSIHDVEEWPERIKAITVDDVNKALSEVFNSQRQLTGHLLARKGL